MKSLGWASFRIGAKTEFNDYRSSAVYGKGIQSGILSSGKLFIGSYGEEQVNSSDERVINSLLKD
ncbi:MAG: hypothetical protein KTR26_15435 [Flammeovirgaceae bacterium]|nr:hypothetical protein [Flammeovirgaceae bacterium]